MARLFSNRQPLQSTMARDLEKQGPRGGKGRERKFLPPAIGPALGRNKHAAGGKDGRPQNRRSGSAESRPESAHTNSEQAGKPPKLKNEEAQDATKQLQGGGPRNHNRDKERMQRTDVCRTPGTKREAPKHRRCAPTTNAVTTVANDGCSLRLRAVKACGKPKENAA